MKTKVKLVAVSIALCVIAAGATGCNKPAYGVHTNMPQDYYEIADESYFIDNTIEGCTAKKSETELLDNAGYSTEGRIFYSMSVEAQLCVSDNFKEDTAKEKFTQFSKAVYAKLNEIDKALSSTVASSDVSKFNAAAAGAELEISKITYEVLSIAKSVYELTDGYYNPALYYNVQAYGFGGAETYPHTAAELPKDEIIQKYTLLASHFGEVALSETADENGVNYFVTKPDFTVEVDGKTLAMKLDLGGIGKGYAVDIIDAMFDEYGYEYGYFNFSASSMAVKSHFEQGAYIMELVGPRSPQRKPYLFTKIRNEKLSTSGDNEQRYFIDGVRYCHIIDPTTGKPIRTGIMSATVIGGSAAEDDALTTAIMAMGKERASNFIKEKLTDRKVVFTCE